MSVFAMVVLIVLIACVTGLLIQRYEVIGKRDNVLDRDQRRAIEAECNAQRAEIAELRDRVKVLERIATDPALRTAREIEGLREIEHSREGGA